MSNKFSLSKTSHQPSPRLHKIVLGAAAVMTGLLVSACTSPSSSSSEKSVLDIDDLEFRGGAFWGVGKTNPMPTTGNAIYRGKISGIVHDIDTTVNSGNLEIGEGDDSRIAKTFVPNTTHSAWVLGTTEVSIDYGSGEGYFDGEVHAHGFGGYSTIHFNEALNVRGNTAVSSDNPAALADTEIRGHFYGTDALYFAGGMQKNLNNGDSFSGYFSTHK